MSDYTWKEIERRFNELVPLMNGARLDFQWGSVPKNVMVAGCGNSSALDKFYAISALAGQKLMQNMNRIDLENIEELKNENNPVKFWFESLKVFSGKFEPDYLGEQLDRNTGQSMGSIFIGRINKIAEVSSVQCINYSISFPDNIISTDTLKSTNQEIVKQSFWDKYAVPIIVSVIASVIAGIILLFL